MSSLSSIIASSVRLEILDLRTFSSVVLQGMMWSVLQIINARGIFTYSCFQLSDSTLPLCAQYFPIHSVPSRTPTIPRAQTRYDDVLYHWSNPANENVESVSFIQQLSCPSFVQFRHTLHDLLFYGCSFWFFRSGISRWELFSLFRIRICGSGQYNVKRLTLSLIIKSQVALQPLLLHCLFPYWIWFHLFICLRFSEFVSQVSQVVLIFADVVVIFLALVWFI